MATDRDYEHIIEQLNQIGSDVIKIKEVLLGKFNGDVPGLLERVRRVETWINARSRIEWFLFTAIIVEVIALVFLAIRFSIFP